MDGDGPNYHGHGPIHHGFPPGAGNAYIVVFKEWVQLDEIQRLRQWVESQGGRVTHDYDTLIKGFAGWIPEQVIQRLRGHESIEYIDIDHANVRTQ
jgi:hypothetical protein